MKRYTGQKALYEAISRSRAKAKRGNILERFLPEAVQQEKPGLPEEPLPVEPAAVPVDQPAAVVSEPPQVPPVPEKPPEPAQVKRSAKLRRFGKVEPVLEEPAQLKPSVVEKIDPPDPPRPVQTWWRAKAVQWHSGRIEIALSYHIAVVVGLVLVLVILAAFRLGQKYPGSKASAAATPTALGSTAAGAPAAQPTRVETPPAPVRASEPAASPKDNWIVVAQHKQKEELEFVKEYFDKNGIKLRIDSLPYIRKAFADSGLNVARLPKGDDFLLATSDFYGNPNSPGTDGYAMRQKIIEIGKKYKAPSGHETFAPNYFKDVYGIKMTK